MLSSVHATAGSLRATTPRAARRRSSAAVVRAQAVDAPAATQLNKYSSRITQPKSQGASQAMLYATGLTEADMNKAQARRPITAL